MVRQEGRAVKLDKLSMTRQEAQLKKRNFVEKFFPLINKKSDKETADTMTQRLGRHYQMDTRRNVSDNLNGRSSTHKRKMLSAENNFNGQYESPGKKQRLERFNSAVIFWGQGPTSTALQDFRSNTCDTKQRIGDHQDTDTDLDSEGPQ